MYDHFGDISVDNIAGISYVRAFGRALSPYTSDGIFGISLFRPHDGWSAVVHAQLAKAANIVASQCVTVTAPISLGPRLLQFPCSKHAGGHTLGLFEDSFITRKKGRTVITVGDHATLSPMNDMPLACYEACVATVELGGSPCSAFSALGSGMTGAESGDIVGGVVGNSSRGSLKGSVDNAVRSSGALRAISVSPLEELCMQMCALVSGSSSAGPVIHAACVALAKFVAHPDTHPSDAVKAAIACAQLSSHGVCESDLAVAEPGPLLAVLGCALLTVNLPPALEDAADVARVYVYNAFGTPLHLRRFQTTSDSDDSDSGEDACCDSDTATTSFDERVDAVASQTVTAAGASPESVQK